MWLSYLIQLGKKIGLSAIFLVIPANVVKAEARPALAPVLKEAETARSPRHVPRRDTAPHNGDASFLAQNDRFRFWLPTMICWMKKLIICCKHTKRKTA